jgi:hypothetical protein
VILLKSASFLSLLPSIFVLGSVSFFAYSLISFWHGCYSAQQQIFNFAAVPNSSPSKASWNTSQQVQHGNQLDYLKHVDISRNMENQIMEKKTSIKSVMVMRCSRLATEKTTLMTTMAPKDQVDKSKNM